MSMLAMHNVVAVYVADPVRDKCQTVWHGEQRIPESQAFSGLLQLFMQYMQLP